MMGLLHTINVYLPAGNISRKAIVFIYEMFYKDEEGNLLAQTRTNRYDIDIRKAITIEQNNRAHSDQKGNTMSEIQNQNDLHNQPDSYWKERLTPEQYKIMRKKGTEPAFSGALYHNHDQGIYACAACGQQLFSSDAKFESGSGWPSFDQPINREHVELHEDNSFFMRRTEITCKNCGAHLGHVFNDGPRETTGLRYCINSVSLDFKKDQSGQPE
jgi:peptide-methionine (R)-S-oxide reductase